MTIQTSYNQALPSENAIGGTSCMYAVVIPASTIAHSGGAIKVSFHGAANIANAWIGHQGVSALDFDGNQVQLKRAGNGSFTLDGLTALDAVTFALDETKPLVVRFDAYASGSYKKVTGLSSDRQFYYKVGHAAGDNGNTIAQSGYEASASGQTAFVTKVEVGAVLSDFTIIPETPSAPAAGGIAEVLANEIFESGGRKPASATEHLIFALFNPTGSGIRAVPMEVEITPDADCDFTVRTIVTNNGNIMPSRCNSNFKLNPLFAPGSKAKLYSSYEAPPLSDNATQHAFKTARAGVTKVIHADAIAVLYPGELGFGILLPVGVGAAINIRWREISDA